MATDADIEADKAQEDEEAHWVDTLKSVLIAITVALGIRSFVVEPFKIPSGSMIPTLLIGDYILVQKYAYGVRNPWTGEIWIETGEPERGDVVVFRFPDNPKVDFIKRVVGLPGDEIKVKRQTVYVNGVAVDKAPKGTYYKTDCRTGGRGTPMARYREENPEGRVYTIVHERTPPRLFEQTFNVPEDSYFMMGDNRDNSSDSRKWARSFVTKDQLKGRAFMVHWSWDVPHQESRGFVEDFADTVEKFFSRQICDVRWDRIGRSVDGIAAPDPDAARDPGASRDPARGSARDD